eukprot:jgi/Botrbrau1/6644/Bobra.104_2s0031.1
MNLRTIGASRTASLVRLVIWTCGFSKVFRTGAALGQSYIQHVGLQAPAADLAMERTSPTKRRTLNALAMAISQGAEVIHTDRPETIASVSL